MVCSGKLYDFYFLMLSKTKPKKTYIYSKKLVNDY